MNRIIADDLNSVDSDIYIMTHVTNPLLRADTILSALLEFQKAYSEKTADSLFSVNKHLTRFYKADGSAINHDPNVLVPTQNLEPWFEENSNLYIFTKSSFQESGARIGQNPILFETPRFESIDIDDPEDWDLAELIASAVGE